MAAHSDKGRFAFVEQDGNDQGSSSMSLIKSHAMRESLRMRRVGTDIFRSAPGAEPFKTGRWRLADAKSSGKKGKKDERREQGKKRASSNFSRSSSTAEPGRLADENLDKRLVIAPNVTSSREPFDVMPIKIGHRQQLILYHYSTSFTQNATAFNSEGKYMDIAASSPVWLWSSLAIVTLSREYLMGLRGVPSEDYFYHRGQALQLVKKILSENPQAPLHDSVIGATASMVCAEVKLGHRLTSSMHLKGLIEMVDSRGGIEELSRANNFLGMLVGWSDLAYSSTFGTAPVLPLQETYLRSNPPSSKQSTPLTNTEIESNLSTTDTLTSLKQLSHMQSNYSSLTHEARQFFANNVYAIQHTILVNESAIDADCNLSQTKRMSSHSIRLASSLYTCLILREVPVGAASNFLNAKRIKDRLSEMPMKSLVQQWDECPSLLMWIAFMALVACVGREERRWFMGLLLECVRKDGVSSAQEFGDKLGEWPWVKNTCDSLAVVLWIEIETLLAS